MSDASKGRHTDGLLRVVPSGDGDVPQQSYSI